MANPAVDLRGRTCVVTGASSGIGLAAAQALARLRADLVLLCRDGERAERARASIVAMTGNPRVEVLLADLSSQNSIRRVAARLLGERRALHVLLNNAGVFMLRRRLTVDGIETTFAVNHLAYFLLTRLLLDRIVASAPARIVNVASDAHRLRGVRMRFDDLQGERQYRAMRAYGQSKLANILFTRALARRLEGSGVTANCLHPGMVATGLGANNGWLARGVLRLLRPWSRCPDDGADTAVWLCTAPELQGVSGKYFADRRERPPSRAARDDADAERLWLVSEQLTRLVPTPRRGSATASAQSSYKGDA